MQTSLARILRERLIRIDLFFGDFFLAPFAYHSRCTEYSFASLSMSWKWIETLHWIRTISLNCVQSHGAMGNGAIQHYLQIYYNWIRYEFIFGLVMRVVWPLSTAFSDVTQHKWETKLRYRFGFKTNLQAINLQNFNLNSLNNLSFAT